MILAIFGLAYFLRSRGKLNFTLTAVFGTVGMFVVFLGNALSNGTSVGASIAVALLLALVTGALLFGLLKAMGFDDSAGG